LFTIGTITLHKLEILIAISTNLEFGNDDFTFDLLHTLNKISINLIPIKIKVHDSKLLGGHYWKKSKLKTLIWGLK